ncbi:hypothetical protein IWQ54_001102 [Labrenzia sp. EL_195]|nr:hypothetical protein [Labrenzia sp. EL_195]
MTDQALFAEFRQLAVPENAWIPGHDFLLGDHVGRIKALNA